MTAVTLRKATWEDSRRLWRWRNEKQVRLNSFSTRQIPYETHKRWLKNTLENPATSIWIGKSSTRVCGMVRFNQQPRKTAEIHISVERALRGKGMGAALLGAACRLARRQGLRKLKAHVLVVNTASYRIFEKNGFQVAGKKKLAGKRAFLMTLSLARKP